MENEDISFKLKFPRFHYFLGFTITVSPFTSISQLLQSTDTSYPFFDLSSQLTSNKAAAPIIIKGKNPPSILTSSSLDKLTII